MAFNPKDAKWYVAEIVEEIQVEGHRRNIVHTNQTLIRADSPNEAYDKALALGKAGNTEYQNPEGRKVTIRFRGLRELDVIHEELEHGAEISFCKHVGVSEKEIKNWIRPKQKLGVFSPVRSHESPDYSSQEIIEEVYERWPQLRKLRGPAHRRKKRH